jgi:hypothetical protein
LIVIEFERHTAESCPVGNEKSLKAQMAYVAKLPEFGKKYGVKMIGGWVIHPQHLGIYVFEAQSVDFVQKFEREPEVMAWRCFTTVDYQMATSVEDVQKSLAAIAIAAKVK